MEHATQPRSILLICNDVVGHRMAGPGIRYWEFSRALGQRFDVTLAVPPYLSQPEVPEPGPAPVRLMVCRTDAQLRALAEAADVVITLGIVPALYPFLTQLRQPLVIDLFDPFLLSGLHQYTGRSPAERGSQHEEFRRVLQLQLRVGDFFLCASERQRDYWLGMLSAVGRVNPLTHAADPTLRRLIEVVPFGLPGELPRHTRQVLKGVHPGIASTDKVVLWGGGIWNWFDAPTLIRAMALIAHRRTDVKAFFLGVERANTATPRMEAAAEAVALSRQLALHDRCVFFNDWVPYAERQNYLLEADVGVSLHRSHIETRFAFRTRFLDYLWAGLPIVATEGDVLADLVRQHDLGYVAPPEDAEGVAAAILRLLDAPDLRDTYRDRFAQAAASYRWDVVTAPLAEFCARPRLAPDRAYVRSMISPGAQLRTAAAESFRLWRSLSAGGAGSLWRKLRDHLGRRGS